MTGPQLRLASAACAVLAAVWTVVMFSTGQITAALFSAAATSLLVVTYGATSFDAGGSRE